MVRDPHPDGQALSDWYDGHWWRTHDEVRRWLTRHRPDVLPALDAEIETLRPDPFPARVLTDLPADLHAGMREVAEHLDPVRLESHELDTFGRHVVHDAFTELVPLALSVLEPLVGRPLEHSYDFLSLYHGSGVCTPHLDAPNAGWTLDVCLAQSDPWPLLVAEAPWPPDVDGSPSPPAPHDPSWREVVMEPGQAIVFAGASVWHGRRRMPDPAGFCHLGFVHAVAEGTGDLVDPRTWSSRFGVPALATVVARTGG